MANLKKIGASILPFVSILLVAQLFMCTGSDREITQFDDEKFIKGRPIPEIPIFSNRNVYLLVVDTFLIVMRKHEKVLKVFNTNDYELLAEYGNIGEGSHDFSDPFLLKQVSYDKVDGSPEIMVYDYQRRVINRINLLGLINENGDFHQQFALEERVLFYRHFYYNSPDYHIGISDGTTKFTLYNKRNNTFLNAPYSPELEIEIDPSLLYPIYRSAIAVNEKAKKIAAATLFIPSLEFYNLRLESLEALNFESTQVLINSLEEYAKSGSFDSKQFIVELDSNHDYLLGLSYNNTATEIFSDHSYSDLNFLLFDWDGNLLTKFILSDNKFVQTFAVDFKRKKVYCYLPFEEDYNLYVYDLN